MISNLNQKVDQEKYGENFDNIFRGWDVVLQRAHDKMFKRFYEELSKIIINEKVKDTVDYYIK